VSARDRIVLAVVAALALVAGSWILLIQPKRQQATKLETQVQALQSQLSTARGQIESGLAARAQFSSDYTQLARLGEALPPDDNVPSLMYQIQNAAAGAKVDFRTLQMSTNGSSSAPAPTTSTSSGTSSSSSSSSSGAAAAAPVLPPGATVGSAGFPTEQFSFSFTGSFFHLSSFFNRLESFVVAHNGTINVSGRLLSINGISLGAAPNGFPQITANVSATTYMAPAGSGLLAGATPLGPASTSTPTTASSSGSASPAPATITPTIR
jgi:type II secretory pathway pseudopilin PulG